MVVTNEKEEIKDLIKIHNIGLNEREFVVIQLDDEKAFIDYTQMSKRFSQSILIEHEQDKYLFDAGRGALIRLYQSNILPNEIKNIFVSNKSFMSSIFPEPLIQDFSITYSDRHKVDKIILKINNKLETIWNEYEETRNVKLFKKIQKLKT